MFERNLKHNIMEKSILPQEKFEITISNSNRNGIKAIVRFITFILLLFPLCLYAQQVQEETQMLNDMASSGNDSIIAEGNHIQSLVTMSLPIIFASNDIKINSNGQLVRCEVNAGAVAQLGDANSSYSEVELIIVRLKKPSDMNFTIDLTALNGFPKLKYVLFLSEFVTTANDIKNLFLPQTGIVVFYKVSIPS